MGKSIYDATTLVKAALAAILAKMLWARVSRGEEAVSHHYDD